MTVLIKLLISTSLAFYLGAPSTSGEEAPLNGAPRDYAQSFASSRVRGLVDFFELLQKASNDPSVSQNTNLILSLSQSASKLYTLSHGQPLELRCDRYLKLLSRPNIRTVATISELMGASKSFSEINQQDANLVAKLVADRTFDALARIQTILQTLEMERALGKSSFEPNVEKDLLDCVNYYVYRHQRATSEVVEHVRKSLASLPQTLVASGKHEITLRKLAQTVANIKALEAEESGARFRYQEWLSELKTMQQLVLENEYELPEVVRDLLTDSRRVERLHLIDRGEELVGQLRQFERAGLRDEHERGEYVATLRRLYAICQDYQALIAEEACLLVQDPGRLELMGLGGQIHAEPHVATAMAADSDDLSAPDKPDEEQSLRFEAQKAREPEEVGYSHSNSINKPPVLFNRIDEVRTMSASGGEVVGSIIPDKMTQVGAGETATKSPAHKMKPLRERSAKENEIVKAKSGRPRGRAAKRQQKIPISKDCMELLSLVRVFLLGYNQKKSRLVEVKRVAAKLSEFEMRCVSNKDTHLASLRATLRSWCKKNPHLTHKASCLAILEDLKQLGGAQSDGRR